jgi:hypothetical protein
LSPAAGKLIIRRSEVRVLPGPCARCMNSATTLFKHLIE